MTDQAAPKTPATLDQIYEHLHLFPNPDGTYTRPPSMFPTTPPEPDPTQSKSLVLSKDIHFSCNNNTWARIFLPRQVLDDPSVKLTLIVYFHGSGFVVLSPASTVCHQFCSDVALQLPAVVVSVGYRLAPENRLPAPYDDALVALQWVATTGDPWLHEFADYKKCFLMGTSAGGNIAYHLGLRVSDTNFDFLKIRGLILHQPFFGGTQRTKSEMRLANNPALPVIVSDFLWDVSLPIGADRDHEYSNPTINGGSTQLEKVKELKWRVLMAGTEGDPIIDRHKELVEMLRDQRGIEVEEYFREDGVHGDDFFDLSSSTLLVVLREFTESTMPLV